jgi:hypothetical protein
MEQESPEARISQVPFVDAFRTFCLEPGVQGKSIWLTWVWPFSRSSHRPALSGRRWGDGSGQFRRGSRRWRTTSDPRQYELA